MRLSTITLAAMFLLAVVVSSYSIGYAYNLSVSYHGALGNPYDTQALQQFVALAFPMAALSWAIVGLAFIVDRNGRRTLKKAGVDDNVYDLMVKMKGAGSRLELLRSMDTPKHRSELAQVTGLDWKEVDRDLDLLEKYGIVAVYAESGAIKMYGLTQQGKLLLSLLGEILKGADSADSVKP
jgi:hypothetical protein